MTKKVIMIIFLFVAILQTKAYADEEDVLAEKYGLKVISMEAANQIEELVAENNVILSETLEGASAKARTLVAETEKYSDNSELIKELGGCAPSKELLGDLLVASMGNNFMQQRSLWSAWDDLRREV